MFGWCHPLTQIELMSLPVGPYEYNPPKSELGSYNNKASRYEAPEEQMELDTLLRWCETQHTPLRSKRSEQSCQTCMLDLAIACDFDSFARCKCIYSLDECTSMLHCHYCLQPRVSDLRAGMRKAALKQAKTCASEEICLPIDDLEDP